ncbi:MAG TPA: aminoglycoside phosphotransferase [Rhodocyclaceae bacterium]|nr:MAG: aminoglycoside phosphotransferase [Betaproteobacteria bacterium CG2_30_68_42]PIV74053.1 MAG: aminoglycoside phosphotransferase [Rhodocyclales bacterium CG17_big_fil_post_rev_8_21_14_2_50_68_7]PIX75883.1 MAG: aminoglycoside phosphotransferase [Rhodocyclales bacterium CG_4_10_14_3_um_filter_68_10]PJA58628.1 MAG: aminoglycoside phosphotransferase [Rhodocyclales bacterium CG_4_9_14_3_um_filter_68_10]HCX34264.1 aminoglycoside phosphotransferase [Rhodocyclaceae bacterium]
MAARPDASRSVPGGFAQALRELGLAGSGRMTGMPLAGGVSSDIWRVDTCRGPVCVKRALPKLRVLADWWAPIERNVYEARWMRVANQAVPGCAPELFGQHPGLGVLVMGYLPPPDYLLWKHALRDGNADPALARTLGRTVARIHAYSAARVDLAAQFDAGAIFHDIRLEPYLVATARRHADLASALLRLVAVTQAHAVALVHGDVSPKNILVGPRGPVLLDAECACWGDPAFDLAFCLNHLLLKCLWNVPATAAFLAAFDALSEGYLQAADWEPRDALERRAAALLPGLLLARVDGKSPVEYITEDAGRDAVRQVARSLLRRPVERLQQVAAAWREELGP